MEQLELPPACVTRWQESRYKRLVIAQRLNAQQVVRTQNTRQSQRSSTRKGSSLRCSTKFSTATSSHLRHSSAKALQEQEKPALHLVHAAYLQLCESFSVRPNSGVVKYLSTLNLDQGNALSTLDASANHLGKMGLKVVCELTKCSQRLSVLNLAQQNINAATLAEMLGMLYTHKGLRKVDISQNPLSITAARMLTELAGQTERLEEVRVSGTHITDEWAARINTRLQDNHTRRIEGLIHEPIYRSKWQFRYVSITVLTSSTASFAAELALLNAEVFPRINSVLQLEGVSLLPLVIEAHPEGEKIENWIASLEHSRDQLNLNLPWVIVFYDETDEAQKVGAVPSAMELPNETARRVIAAEGGADAPKIAVAMSYLHHLLEEIPPHPPLIDKNGNKRAPLRGQTPAVHLFHRGATLPDLSYLTPLVNHRLCSWYSYGSEALPHVFTSAVVSQVAVCLDEVYPQGSHTHDQALVAASAEEHYPPEHLTVGDLFGDHPSQTSADQWLIIESLLQNYQRRPFVEQELLGYCDTYTPEGQCAYPLILYGQTGIGKTTIVAYVARELKRKLTSIVIPIFVGASGATATEDGLLRELIEAVRHAYDMPPIGHALEAHALHAEWAELTGTPDVERPKVVILLAGLDELGDDNIGLGVIPASTATNVRVAATVASHSPLLKRLRERVPQPYEVLLPVFHRKECLHILKHSLRIEVPGLSDPDKQDVDEGVIAEPSNPADAVCFKDHGTCPLFLHLTAWLFHLHANDIKDEASALALIRSFPETISDAYVCIIKDLEARFGEVLVEKALTFLCLCKDGFRPEEFLSVLKEECIKWAPGAVLEKLAAEARESKQQKEVFSPGDQSRDTAMLWVLLQPLLAQRGGGGMYTAGHSEFLRVIKRRYPKSLVSGDNLYCALAVHQFKQLSSQLTTPFVHGRALSSLPNALLNSSRVIDAYVLVTDPGFIERKIQAGLYFGLLADTEHVERELRRCIEAGIEGFESYQFKPSPEINHLRAVRDMCVRNEKLLRYCPSVLQVGLSLPDSNSFYKAVHEIIEDQPLPHPLLKLLNKKTRVGLASKSFQLGDGTPVVHVSFCPNSDQGLLLAATTASAVYICDTNQVLQKLQVNEELTKPEDGFLSSVFTPDGKMVVTSAATQVLVWIWEETEAPLRHNILDVAPSITRCLSHDGVAICAVQLGTGKGAVLETRKGRTISTLRAHVNDEPIRNIFYAAATHSVVSVGLGTICVYNGSDQVAYEGHTGLVSCCDISPDGKYVASTDGTDVQLWSAITGETVGVLKKHQVPVLDIQWHPNGHLFSSCDASGVIWVWSSLGQEAVRDPLSTHIGKCHWAGYAPGGGKLFCRCDSGVHMYETTSYSSLGILGGNGGRLTFVAASPDMSTAATADEDGCVQLFSLDDSTYPNHVAWMDTSAVVVPTDNIVDRCDAHTHTCLCVLLSEDGRTLGTVFGDGTLKVWDVQTGELTHNVTGQGVVSAAFVKESSIMVLGKLASIALFDYKSGENVGYLPAFRGLMNEEDGEGLQLVTVSPKCKTISCVMNSSLDPHLAFNAYSFNIAARSKCAAYSIHTDRVTGVGYCSEERLITTSLDRSMRMWTIETQSEKASLAFASPVECLDVRGNLAAVGLSCGLAHVVLYSEAERAFRITASCRAAQLVSAIHIHDEYIITASDDHMVTCWSMNSRQCMTAAMCLDTPRCIASYIKHTKNSTPVHTVFVGGSSGYVRHYEMLCET
eukprot:TRINITY_DN1001_c0_g3_i1.p1 TRINITY_DN1001_c0_g3~~TRINITY_DN1001_c0_g3_i1.p1  ORF type:complete len:1733 (+),score=651.29 TRINITY_DN1001_c0_g3_i1:59-5257(+)